MQKEDDAMFTRCGIEIRQQSNYGNEKWLDIVLTNPKAAPPDSKNFIKQDYAMYEWMISIAKYQYAGKWHVTFNNVNNDGNDTYTIGHAHPDQKWWRYSIQERELQFVETANWVGGGLKFGEMEKSLFITLKLFNVAYTSKGFVPLANSDTAPGMAYDGAKFFQPMKSVTWADFPTFDNKGR